MFPGPGNEVGLLNLVWDLSEKVATSMLKYILTLG